MTRQEWFRPFVFRGLRFREYAGYGWGLQVYNASNRHWYDTDLVSEHHLRRDYRTLPDIQRWDARTRVALGSLRFTKEVPE